MTDHLTCDDVLPLVEPIAAGELEVAANARAHFESCPRCASALATARRIESALSSREAPAAPARFSNTVLLRIRRERWQSEQKVDRLFNAAIVFAVLLVGGGIAALFNVEAMLAGAAAAWRMFAAVSGEAVTKAVPSLATYVASAGLFVSALVTWWWAERRLSL
jgi:anti-sigma factor RsiW